MHKIINKIFLASLLAFPISTALSATNLPDLGSPGLVVYDSQTEQRLGAAFTQALHTHFDLVQDLEVLSYIRRIGHHIAAQAHDHRHFRFYVINESSINAFAGPNGIIGIHSGLITSSESEDELASVIAHEVAHVTQQHLSRRFEHQESANLTTFASLLAAILIGIHDPSAGMAAMLGGTGLNIQQQLKYSRIHEHEADYQGIDLLYKAGYDPNAMAAFFGKLAKQGQIHEFRPPEILLTHPVTETRLAQAQDRAHQFPQIKTQPSLDFELIKLKLRGTSKTAQLFNLSNHYESTLTCYQTLLIEQQNHSCLSDAIAKHPNNRLLKTLEAQLIFKTHPQQAIKQLQALYALYPQDAAILLALSKLHQKSGDTQQAIQLLLKYTPQLRYQYEPYQQLATLYAEQQKMGESALFQSKAYLVLGNRERARYMLDQAKKKQAEMDSSLRKEIERIDQKLN